MPRKMNAPNPSNFQPGELSDRSAIYEKKNKHTVTVTDEGWTKVQKLADGFGVDISELIERLGRGQVTLLDSEATDLMEDALDSALLSQAISETNGDFVSFDELLSSRNMTVEDLQEVDE